MEPIPFDPQLLSSPYYVRRPGTPSMSAGTTQLPPGGPPPPPPGNGLSMGMPMMQPPPGAPSQMRTPSMMPQPPGSPSMGRTKKPNRVLQLPAPLRSRANYSPPLPNDCEGLIYALEGKFDCGMEMVADAATRILEAVNERASQIMHAHDPNAGNNPFRPLLSHGTKLSSAQRSMKIKMLEASWVTSAFLADAIVRSIDKYITILESDLHIANCEPANVLSALNQHCLEFEVVSTLAEALDRWLRLWLTTGCLERPRVPEEEAFAQPRPKTVARPRPSVLVLNPLPPQPRGVGRPRLIPVISMADFVDSVHEPLELPAMKPANKPKVYYKVVRCLLRALSFSTQVFRPAVIEAERLESEHCEKSEHFPGGDSAFPIDLFAEPGSGSQIPATRPQAHLQSVPLTDALTGHSILADAASWNGLASELFVDNELKELFLETVKEAEFLIWRENRRTTSSIEMTTSTAHSSERVRMENELESKDITVSCPVVSLNNQLICVTLATLVQLLRIGDARLTGEHSLAQETANAIIEIWGICQGAATQSQPCIGSADATPRTAMPAQSPSRLPVLFKSIGLHLLSVLLNFGRDYLTLMKPLLRNNDQLKNKLLEILCSASSHVMLSFGRFITTKLFPSVPSSLSYVLDAVAPMCSPNLPMDVQTCKSAVVMALVCLEELEGNPNWNSLWYGLLYCAYGGAVALGRINGFVCTRKTERRKNTSDLRTVEILLRNLPENIRDKTCQLLRQKSPQLASKLPSVAATTMFSELQRDDDLDTTLQSQDNNYLLSTALSSRTGPIDTYDESVEASPLHLDIFQDILYACTNAVVGLAKENREFACFLKQHVKLVEEIGLLSSSPILCRLVEALNNDSDLMRWDTDIDNTAAAFRPAYILTDEQLTS